MSDLVCLVADKNMEATLGGLLRRPQALGIRQITCDLLVHPRRDPGCFHEAPAFLRPYRATYAHALVLFDRDWEGAPAETGDKLQRLLEERLERVGLQDWAEVVVIDPELEIWVFSDSPRVAQCLGWSDQRQPLRQWLQERRLWPPESDKPTDPKLAVEHALYEIRRPRSSSIYRDLATRVGVDRCSDQSFARFRALLRRWFPQH
jgi:hypothetical protein